MGLNLYQGGCGRHETFAVAEDLEDAKKKIGIRLNAPFLPIEATLIDEVDGYSIVPVDSPEISGNEELEEPAFKCKHCEFRCSEPWQMAQHSRKAHPKGA